MSIDIFYPSYTGKGFFFNHVQNSWLATTTPSPIRIKHQGRMLVVPDIETAFQCMIDGNLLSVGKDPRTLRKRTTLPTQHQEMMLTLLRQKFQDRVLCQRLYETPGELVYLNPWDTYWGADQSNQGQNVLGELVMTVRAEI